MELYSFGEVEILMEHGDNQSSEDLILWHGTNQSFDRFDNAMQGLHTYNSASNQAFFLAVSPVTAQDYARQAARNLIPNHMEHERALQAILDKAERQLEQGKYDEYESLIQEAEEFEAAALQAEPSGGVILKCRVSVSNLFEIDGSSRDVLCNLGHVLTEAKRRGHDAVLFRNINDTPSGLGGADDHLAIFDGAAIDILEVFDAEKCQNARPHPIPTSRLITRDPFFSDMSRHDQDLAPA